MPAPIITGAVYVHSAPRDALARGVARFAAAVRRLEPDLWLGRFRPGLGWPADAHKLTRDLSEGALVEHLRAADGVSLVGDPHLDPHALELSALVRNWEQERGMPIRYAPRLRSAHLDAEGGGILNLFGPRWTDARAGPLFEALATCLPALRSVAVRPHAGPQRRWLSAAVRDAVGLGGAGGWLTPDEEAGAPSEEEVFQRWNGLPPRPAPPWLAPNLEDEELEARSRAVARSLVGRRLVAASLLQHHRNGDAVDAGHGPFELVFDDGGVVYAWPFGDGIVLGDGPLPERSASWRHPSGATDTLSLRPLDAAPLGAVVSQVEEGWSVWAGSSSSMGWALRFDTGAVLRVHAGLFTPEATISTGDPAPRRTRSEACTERWEPVAP